MKDSDALQLIVLISIGAQLKSLKEQMADMDWGHPAFSNGAQKVFEAIYSDIKDADDRIQDYFANTGLDDKMINLIEGKYED